MRANPPDQDQPASAGSSLPPGSPGGWAASLSPPAGFHPAPAESPVILHPDTRRPSVFLLRPADHPTRHPLGPGGFAPDPAQPQWWRDADLAAPLPWSEGDCRGWAIPGYQNLSLAKVPWESIRWEPTGPWRQIKKASTRRVACLQRDSPPETLFVKWSLIRQPFKLFGTAFRPSRAALEFDLARRVLASGFLTPTPVLFAERRRGPFLLDSYLVTRGLDAEWASVHALWKRRHADKTTGGTTATSQDTQREIARLIDDLGRAVRAFHDHGFSFADSRAHHWFTRADAPDRDNDAGIFQRWAVLDLDDSRLGTPPSPARRRRFLAMLLASFPRSSWTPDHSRQLLDAYFRGEKMQSSEYDRIFRMADRMYLRRNPKHPPVPAIEGPGT